MRLSVSYAVGFCRAHAKSKFRSGAQPVLGSMRRCAAPLRVPPTRSPMRLSRDGVFVPCQRHSPSISVRASIRIRPVAP